MASSPRPRGLPAISHPALHYLRCVPVGRRRRLVGGVSSSGVLSLHLVRSHLDSSCGQTGQHVPNTFRVFERVHLLNGLRACCPFLRRGGLRRQFGSIAERNRLQIVPLCHQHRWPRNCVAQGVARMAAHRGPFSKGAQRCGRCLIQVIRSDGTSSTHRGVGRCSSTHAAASRRTSLVGTV